MFLKQRLFSISIIIVGFLILVQCAGNTFETPGAKMPASGGHVTLDINDLSEGTEIRNAGQRLMDEPYGLVELKDGDHRNDSVLVIAVHGYQSRGYEWVTGLKNLAHYFGSLYFFRYDWERCPDQISKSLVSHIKLAMKTGSYKKLILFGHSYGGVVVTYAASQLTRIPTEIHVIAAPLSGFPGLLDQCESLTYDTDDKLIYPEWKKSVHVIQHRTVHAQDGAFRELAIDPQDIDLPFQKVQELPPTMDGHRLGHNWSVSWVLDQYVGKPHRY